MTRRIGLVALVVKDYDEAIDFYTKKLGFRVSEDIALGAKRWVVLAAGDDAETQLLLAQADDDEQVRHIGNQTGGRVSLFLYTDDFENDHASMKHAGVHFEEEPRTEVYGTVAVFQDLYGNRWDLIQLAKP
jgi:catechol 2,3-dioxygenase-like lactoylglutathione lyase family enzyme